MFRLSPTTPCMIGPLALSSCTATVLAHGPVLGPAPPHRHPSCPAAPQTGTSRTPFGTPGSAAPSSPPQPGAALRLIAPPLFGAALVHACLCISLHRCTPRTAPLSMRSAAPCARRSAYRASEFCGSAHAPNRQVTGFGKGRVRLSAPYFAPLRRPGCGCSAAGGGGQVRQLGRT